MSNYILFLSILSFFKEIFENENIDISKIIKFFLECFLKLTKFIMLNSKDILIYIIPKVLTMLKNSNKKLFAFCIYFIKNNQKFKSVLLFFLKFFFKILKTLYSTKNSINKDVFEFLSVFNNINKKLDNEINEILSSNYYTFIDNLNESTLTEINQTIFDHADTIKSFVKEEWTNQLLIEPNANQAELTNQPLTKSNENQTKFKLNLTERNATTTPRINKKEYCLHKQKDLLDWLEANKSNTLFCSNSEKQNLASKANVTVHEINNWLKYQKRKQRKELFENFQKTL